MTYTATINGQTFTRTSDRTYTHVVVARDAEWYDQNGNLYPQDDTFGVIGFCGRPDLAEKLAQQTREQRAITGYTVQNSRRGFRTTRAIRNGAHMYRDVTILPLIDTES